MAILITVETLILGLLTLLVAGLLRSHAEILRQLAELGDGAAPSARAGEELPPARDGASPAFDVVGATVEGDAVKVAVARAGGNTLLAFLSSDCLPCRKLWNGLSGGPLRLPGKARLAVITKDRTEESPTKLRQLAPPDVTLVMSTAAWQDYGVKGSPYFIYVDGPAGQVHSEGSATSWDQVVSLLHDALADDELGQSSNGASQPVEGRAADGAAGRIRRADEELAAAGIHPGHPSLWRGDANVEARSSEKADERG